ncbi:hypothetical protein [Streptomyces hirsutus]|uniref:hypothetical protein n=1 Tax=Streptomyces hirsutus TaxID=35620 RepID=UPI0036998A20
MGMDIRDQDQDQDDVAGPAQPPLTTAQAREMTAGLREATDGVRRSVAVLAAQTRATRTPPVSGSLSGTAAGSRAATRSTASAAPRRTGSWTSPAPSPPSPSAPRRLAAELITRQLATLAQNGPY